MIYKSIIDRFGNSLNPIVAIYFYDVLPDKDLFIGVNLYEHLLIIN